MSLSRSEEMHRLTENVYKVSPAPARGGPWAHGGLPRTAAGTRRRSGIGWRGRPRPESPARPSVRSSRARGRSPRT